MPSILQTLQRQLGGGVTGQISRQLGADPSTTGNAISAAVPLLLGACAWNASDEAGAVACTARS